MGHSNNQARRRLTLPLPLRAKMIGLAMFIGGFMGLIASAQLDPITARVERVIDGDTIQVRFEGKSYTVRLIGVDTPETKHPTKAVQYFGREASAFTKAIPPTNTDAPVSWPNGSAALTRSVMPNRRGPRHGAPASRPKQDISTWP